MPQPKLQAFWLRLTFLIAGVLFLGNVLNALLNASQLVFPAVTYISTALILLGWLAARAYLRPGRAWTFGGQEYRIRRLGPLPQWFLCGIILLLWYPRAMEFVKQKRVASQQKIEPTVEFRRLAP